MSIIDVFLITFGKDLFFLDVHFRVVVSKIIITVDQVNEVTKNWNGNIWKEIKNNEN